MGKYMANFPPVWSTCNHLQQIVLYVFLLSTEGRDAIPSTQFYMMTSSNGNIFLVTGHLCGEFTGHRWIPRTKASDASLVFMRRIQRWPMDSPHKEPATWKMFPVDDVFMIKSWTLVWPRTAGTPCVNSFHCITDIYTEPSEQSHIWFS